ncbi:hypothetical protein [Streptomyces reniochalinae]|uniref:Uncharacterized protein n=1 Tax=Streptomyces reniochalinae TaxID=2250578 RepID=A0A367E811_9ACTN|nr:hypothetical protein [Streptomyces reniochalinae]RCG14178.1 hypothetical protein DQ392_29055 [Streptomyces reniochalinae]
MSMRHYIGDQQVIADDEALELALDLYVGQDDETEEETAARLDAGRDILAADPELFDRAARVVAAALVATPRSNVVPFRPRQRTARPEVAA